MTTVTPEGVDPIPRVLDRPCYALTVATGTARKRDARPGRQAQLSLMAVQLSVRVAVRLEDGTAGPPSPVMPVGAAYP